MTTIAYKNGVVAYDSRITIDNLIVDDDYEKMIEHNKVLFFMTGSTCDYQSFVRAYFNKDHGYKELDIAAIVIENGDIYYSALGDNGLVWKSPIRKTSSFAIGTGRSFALAFMDMGLSAEEAVAKTIKRDSNSGGLVRSRFVL